MFDIERLNDYTYCSLRAISITLAEFDPAYLNKLILDSYLRGERAQGLVISSKVWQNIICTVHHLWKDYFTPTNDSISIIGGSLGVLHGLDLYTDAFLPPSKQFLVDGEGILFWSKDGELFSIRLLFS